jgi:hypothetical protein
MLCLRTVDFTKWFPSEERRMTSLRHVKWAMKKDNLGHVEFGGRQLIKWKWHGPNKKFGKNIFNIEQIRTITKGVENKKDYLKYMTLVI